MTGIINTLGIKLGSTSDSAASAASSGVTPGEVLAVDEQTSTADALEVAVVEDGNSDSATAVAAGVGTFVVAYAVHKCFAPLRIAATLTATPLIVRHLRRIGILKPPKPKVAQ